MVLANPTIVVEQQGQGELLHKLFYMLYFLVATVCKPTTYFYGDQKARDPRA
jgi:hypothetical protein